MEINRHWDWDLSREETCAIQRDMRFFCLFVIASLSSALAAGVKSGKTQAEWLSASPTYTAGQGVQTALRLVVDEHWHTYWSNPGEGGLKISVKWDLPPGWTAGELEHPSPKRFMTGELSGFGYEGTVIFPVKLMPPAGFTGTAVAKAKFSWLTCNQELCLPGNAALSLTLNAGTPSPSGDEAAILEGLKKIPHAQSDLKLSVSESAKTLSLTLHGPSAFDAADYEIFPLTPSVIDSSAQFRFVKKGSDWSADLPKSEYATSPIQGLSLVLASKSGQPALLVEWKKK
jgi:DsbC/DsbD-like thiol-disulfide interchange protein